MSPVIYNTNYQSIRFNRQIDKKTSPIVECGEDKSKSQAYAIAAAIAEPNTAPWHIGIYEKSRSTYEYRCGGTIVSNKVIVSGEHLGEFCSIIR